MITAQIISGYNDNYCARLNGTSQYFYKSNPSFKSDTAGCWSGWVRINTLLAADGAMAISSLADAGAIVGTYGKSFGFFIRRHSAGYGNTNNYLDLTVITTGSNPAVKSGSTPLTAASWLHVAYQSDGKIFLNGVEETYQYWLSSHWVSGWYSDFTATNKDTALGAQRKAGTASNFAAIDLNQQLYFNRALTAPEVLAVYNAGMGADPRMLSFVQADPTMLISGYGFEQSPRDDYGPNILTEVGSPTYVTP